MSDAIAKRDPFAVSSMAEAFQLAETLAKARGFVPDAYVNQPAAIMAAILTGHELGLPPMTSLREIHVIKGKPTLSATLMLMLVQRAGIKTRWIESTATRAVIGVTLSGQEEQSMGFSIEEARTAGLAGQGNWKTYPAAMLRARATSSAIKAFCPHVIGGSVYESESGEITGGEPTITVESSPVSEPAPLVGRIDAPPAETPPTNGRLLLSACADGDQLAAWCDAERPKMAARSLAAQQRVIAACYERADAIGMTHGAVRYRLGLPTEDAAPAEVPVEESKPQPGWLAATR